MTGNCHRHMAAPSCLVIRIDYLAILEDADAAVGSSTMLVTSKPAPSNTYPMLFTLPSETPGGMAAAA